MCKGFYYDGKMLKRFEVQNKFYINFVRWVLDNGFNIVYVNKSVDLHL